MTEQFFKINECAFSIGAHNHMLSIDSKERKPGYGWFMWFDLFAKPCRGLCPSMAISDTKQHGLWNTHHTFLQAVKGMEHTERHSAV